MARTLLSAVKVRQVRMKFGLEQTEAARRAGWKRGQSWHKLELRDGDVRVSTLATLAPVLNYRVRDLLVPRHRRLRRR